MSAARSPASGRRMPVCPGCDCLRLQDRRQRRGRQIARAYPPLRAASKTSALRQLSRAERADLLAVAPGTAGGGVVDRLTSARFSTTEVRDALAGLEAPTRAGQRGCCPEVHWPGGVLVASTRCDVSPRISPVESLLWKGTCGCASGWVRPQTCAWTHLTTSRRARQGLRSAVRTGSERMPEIVGAAVAPAMMKRLGCRRRHSSESACRRRLARQRVDLSPPRRWVLLHGQPPRAGRQWPHGIL